MSNLPLLTRCLLFVISYLPLLVIFLIIDFRSIAYPFFQHGAWSLGGVLFIVACLVLVFSVLRHFERQGSAGNDVQDEVLLSLKSLDRELMGYVVTYMLPLLGLPVTNRIPVILFLIFLIGVLYVNSNMIGLNPVFAIFGYSFFELL